MLFSYHLTPWCGVHFQSWQDENDVARQLVGFLQQFLEIFSELKGKKFYLTGESVSKSRASYHR